MPKIIQKEDKRLRETAEAVKAAEFGSASLTKLLKEMSAALAKEDDGVAIAAPQIGVSKRIFVVSSKMKPGTTSDLIFINPVIKQKSKKKVTLEEGCLSVRWLYGRTKRAEKVTVEAYDELGKKFTRNGSGVWAQIFQHEIDHLNGILFTDHATQIEELKPEGK